MNDNLNIFIMGNTKIKIVKIARRADTGQYTTKKYAETHPNTTVIERRKIEIKLKSTSKSKKGK